MFSILKKGRAPLQEATPIHQLAFSSDVRACPFDEEHLDLHQRPFRWEPRIQLHCLAVVLIRLEDDVALLRVFARIHEPGNFASTLRL